MNLCKEILLGLFLLFTAFFIGRRLLALAAVVCDTHASFRIQQRELLNAKRQGPRRDCTSLRSCWSRSRPRA